MWKKTQKHLCEAFCKDYSLQTDLAALSALSPNAIEYNYVKSISKTTQSWVVFFLFWGFLGQERKLCDTKVFRSGSCACLASNCSETVNLCVVFQGFTLQNHSLCALNSYTFKLTTSKSAVWKMASSTTFNVENKSKLAKSHWVSAKTQFFLAYLTANLLEIICAEI